MSIFKVIAETIWTVREMMNGHIKCTAMEYGELVTANFELEDFSRDDQKKVVLGATFREFEFLEDDEVEGRQHVIALRVK